MLDKWLRKKLEELHGLSEQIMHYVGSDIYTGIEGEIFAEVKNVLDILDDNAEVFRNSYQ